MRLERLTTPGQKTGRRLVIGERSLSLRYLPWLKAKNPSPPKGFCRGARYDKKRSSGPRHYWLLRSHTPPVQLRRQVASLLPAVREKLEIPQGRQTRKLRMPAKKWVIIGHCRCHPEPIIARHHHPFVALRCSKCRRSVNALWSYQPTQQNADPKDHSKTP